MCLRSGKEKEAGQMAVELAVVLPVVIAVLVIVVDCMVFMGTCARFDHIASQKVLAVATSPARELFEQEARVREVQTTLEEQFSSDTCSVEVACEDAQVPLSSMARYRCTLNMVPWPFSLGGAGVFGVQAPARLEHECVLAIDPYTPGEL